MLNKLNEEQLALIPVIREEWIANGVSTSQQDYCDDLTIADFYRKILMRTWKQTIWVDSPKAGAFTANAVVFLKETKSSETLGTLSSKTKEKIKKIHPVHPYLHGNLDAWVSFYSYFNRIGLEYGKDQKLFDLFVKICKGTHFFWALEEIAIISKRPIELHRKNDVLHFDGGPAIRYADGFSVWSLNGVRVPKWLAETPDTQIDPKKFAEIDNVEVRREFVRKVGIDRIVHAIGGKVIDKSGDYELILVDLGGTTGSWPYLKMKNPSIDAWHMECVSKECKTVQDAINFRASGLKTLKGDWQPEKLT